jgi:drug/metabolite transporter (DMT)-like permease
MPLLTQRSSALLVFVILSLAWSYNWLVMKLAMQFAGPFTVAVLRCLAGSACLLAIMGLRGVSLRPQAVPQTIALGMLHAAFLALSQLALINGGAGKTAVLAYTMPFWAVLLNWLFLHERLRRVQWIATLLAGAGLMLIVQPWSPDSTAISKLLATAAGLSWAGSVIVANRLYARHQVSMLSVTLWQLIFSAVPLAGIAWAAQEPPITWNLEFFVILLFAGALCSGLGWLMWMYLLKRIPSSTLSLNSLVIPVLAVAASWIQLDERPDDLEIAGMLIIGVALGTMSLYSRWKARRQRALLAREAG